MSETVFRPCTGYPGIPDTGCHNPAECTSKRWCAAACTTGVPYHAPDPPLGTITLIASSEAQNATQGIKHIKSWIHSGDRQDDDQLQCSQWGQDVCQWITGYCDHLRSENVRLRQELAEAQE